VPGDHVDPGRETPASNARDRIADDRDLTSESHRAAAEARDDRAEARDDRAEARERDFGRFDAGAASDRAEALRDRRGAASDRAHAAADREAASSDRDVSAGERALSSIDGLTGAHRRDSGIVELERETARAKRTGQLLVLAFVDVDGLKAINDSFGHPAGDQLLRQIAETIRANLRSYDLIVRYGGDEFLCGLLDMKIEEASRRFLLVNTHLADSHHASVTVGLAELLKGDDSLAELIGRADEALYREREQRPLHRA